MARSQNRTPAPARRKSRTSTTTEHSRRPPDAALPVGSKLDQLIALLGRKSGASIAEMMDATGWQAHSVRGALAGALRKRGLAITSDKAGGERRYRTDR